MKKLSMMLLVTAMAFQLAACANSAGSQSASGETSAAQTAATEVQQETGLAETAAAGGDVSAETAADAPETVVIKSYNANKEEIDLEVPYNPQRIAILDMASLDILDNLGLGDRVVGTASTSLDYLLSYAENENISNLGTIKEADMEAVMACEPDVIFVGGRLSASYDALSEIAPVVYLSTDTEIGVVESVRKNAGIIASMFGLEEEVNGLMADFDARIAALAAAAQGKNAIVGMCTSGSFNVLGNDGRCSIIGVEIGFENLGNADTTSTHGNETSFEYIVEKNPDYIFVMDRDAAIATEGAQLAQEIMENELVMGTDAYKNGNIVYLEHPAVWYTAEGGVTALDIMLADLESALITQ
nr:ABC transporter substrate-binding protein [uncultured Acetatifactor sp.]